jgi:hypothetical protein
MPSQRVSTGPVGAGLLAALRSRSRVARSARAIARWSALIAGVGLGIFHLFLFWDRVVGGELFNPAIALKWLAATGLVAALAVLRRMGVPLTSGRKACVVWLLVVLLHASGRGVPMAKDETASGLDASVIFVLPSTLTLVGLGLLCETIARRRLLAFAPAGRVVEPASPRPCGGWRRGGTTRAPPLHSF